MIQKVHMKNIGCLLTVLLFIPALAQADGKFSFIAFGDMPYGAPAIVGPPFERLIKAINQADPAFSIHVGDFKSGSLPCSDEEFKRQRAYFDTFEGALIFTPGDNEWTDCHREKAGGYDPLERLARLRQIFFDTGDYSLGASPIVLQRQSDLGTGEERTYIENQRWMHNNILFMTAHIVGSNNGFQATRPAMVQEFIARSRANRVWIESGFREATETGAAAIVLAIHADVFAGRETRNIWPEQSGFGETMVLFRRLAESFGRPVLLIHGDSHVFIVDQPFTSANPENRGRRLDNVTRLEVFGAPDVHAVRIMVDPDRPEIFGFAPFFGPGNRAFSDD